MAIFRSFKVVLDVDHITERSVVVQKILRQARAGKRREMILSQGLSKDVSVLFFCTARLDTRSSYIFRTGLPLPMHRR